MIDADDPAISQSTIDWVEGFVPAQIGAAYVPHITVGFATLADLKEIEAAVFDAFDVHHVERGGVPPRQQRDGTPTTEGVAPRSHGTGRFW